MEERVRGKTREEQLAVIRLYEGLARIKVMSEFTCTHSCHPINSLFQAGMIRMEQEEFFIEPVERGDGVIEEEEREGGGGGRTHIVYRSSAIKKVPIGSEAADFHSRGQSVAPTVPPSTFTHPSLDAAPCPVLTPSSPAAAYVNYLTPLTAS